MERPDFVATIDQALAEVPQQARVIAAYWKALIAEGVDEWDALQLTRDLAATIFSPPNTEAEAKPQPDEDEPS